jgi:hypothetical protein
MPRRPQRNPTRWPLPSMEGAGVLERWTEFKKSDVPALNRRLHEKQAPAIRIEADQTVEESNDEE